MESILTSIKKKLGLTEEYEYFDADIIVDINTVFMILDQLGIGPSGGFSITDKTTTWDEYSEDSNFVKAVISYMALKVRLMFDPPTNSAVAEEFRKNAAELEWRINVQVDPSSN